MQPQELADKYLGAWNRQDVDGLLALMHEGASYYDAFWRETCVGRDLPEYFQGFFEEECYWYKQDGELITTDSSVVLRYHAHAVDGKEIGDVVYSGADVLTLRDGKILTSTDYYCEPDPTCLLAVAKSAERRHGETRYANAGLSGLKSWLVREQMLELIGKNQAFRDPQLTLADVAQQIGCSVEQLHQVVDYEFRSDFDDFLDVQRSNYASDLLRQAKNEPNYMSRIATQAGFTSTDDFYLAFSKSFGMTPKEYQRFNPHT